MNYINEKINELLIPSGKHDVENIIKRYPKKIKIMTDEVTRMVFSNRAEINSNISYKIKNKEEYGMLNLIFNEPLNENEQSKIKYSAYDWVVMEAVASFYMFAQEKYLKNGQLIVDIESIDKFIKRNIKSRSCKENIWESELVKCINKLLSSHITIIESSGNYEGNLLEGYLDIISEKICLVVKKPIMLEFADMNGRNYIETLEIDKLKLKGIHFTFENIAIYRFILDRLRIIFGSYFIDEKHINAVNTNSIPLRSIIEAVYPEGIQQYADVASKERFIWEHTLNICEAMKKNTNFFLDYKHNEVNSKGDKTIRFLRKK